MRAAGRRAIAAVPALLGLLALACVGASTTARAQDLPEDWLPRRLPTERVTTLDVNLFPILFYTPETQVGAGIGTWIIGRDGQNGLRGKPDNLWMNVVYTQQEQLIVQVIPEYYFAGETYRLKAWFRYLDFPTRFYGIGNDSLPDAEEGFTPLTRSLNVHFTRRLVAALSAGVALDYTDTRILATEPGGLLDSGGVPGDTGSRLFGWGLVARWDSREHLFNPRDGSLLEFTTLRYHELDTDAFHFTRNALDARQYFATGENSVLVLRGLVQGVQGEAPFTALPQLGGKFIMRGFFEGRYRDHDLLLLESEWRVNLHQRWGAAFFASWGDVAQNLADLDPAEFKLAGGMGLRWTYNRRERIKLRLDFAATEESTGVYFSVGEAF